MKILAILRPARATGITDAIAAQAADELRELWQLYAGDRVREMYSPGGPGAVLVLEAASAEEAAGHLQRLPLLTSGTMTLETIELHPFGALGMLFGD
jgi:hypothetical protein